MSDTTLNNKKIPDGIDIIIADKNFYQRFVLSDKITQQQEQVKPEKK